MLALPLEIRQLLRTESIKKNIRIHFPNGEWNDITNDNIEYESVSFTESICSQNNLKFGLCEASVFEVTVFGVANIKGCDIEVYLEIDISSLSTELIEQYGMTSPDVSFPYYRVPYGTFTVDSCKRQADMSKRHIVAYSQIISDDSPLSPAERVKQAMPVKNNANYEFDLQRFIYSNIRNIDESLFDLEEVGDGIEIDYGFRHLVSMAGSDVKVYVEAHGYSSPDRNNESYGPCIPLIGCKYEEVLTQKEIEEEICGILSKYYSASDLNMAMPHIIKKLLPLIKPSFHALSLISFSGNKEWVSGFVNTDGYLLYPYITGLGDEDFKYLAENIALYCPKKIAITIKQNSNVVEEKQIEIYRNVKIINYHIKEENQSFDIWSWQRNRLYSG